MAKLYANENVANPIVEHLSKLGHDVVTSLQAGNANLAIPDPDVLAYANREGRILLSNNRRDFLRLHRDGNAHCGLVLFTVDADFPALAGRINVALRAVLGKPRPLVIVTKAGHLVS